MLKKYYFLLAALALLSFGSCNKNKNMVNATVIDTGDVTYQGCGYVLRLDDSALVKPTYLPGAYQHNGLQVRVEYHHTGIKDTCRYGSVIYDMVKIDDIEKRLN